MRWEQPVQYASISDIGFRRRNNQDACVARICPEKATWKRRGHLFLVADGMGGHAVGELASKIAVDTLPHAYYKLKEADISDALQQAIETTNHTIYERAAHNRDFERMGTTCTALALSPLGAVIAHVGDSRVYRIRDGRIDQLTFDHSLQWELLKQGKMKPEEIFIQQPRNVITRSLGPEPTVKVDTEGPYPVFPGDSYLLCSDGLTGHVTDAEIGSIVTELPPGEACRLLVHLANLRGGSDNITVVIVHAGELPDGLSTHDVHVPPEQEAGLHWWLWASIWVIAATFVAAVSEALARKPVEAVVIGALALAALLALAIYWWDKRPRRITGNPDLAETTVWRPYRTASAQFNPKFLTHLAAVEAELQRTATEEGWSINWPELETTFNAAKNAITEKQFRQAFRHYAKAIDVLMCGVQLQRKQMDREAKWGKGSSSPTQEASS